MQPQNRSRVTLVAVDWEKAAREAAYRLEDLCKNCGYSLRTVQRFVSQKFRVSLRAFVNDMRLARAVTLLRTGLPVKEVAIELGYKQTSHFVRCYRAKFGITPGAHGSRMLESGVFPAKLDVPDSSQPDSRSDAA
jgi:AraC family carnitine catabolism transcriptional activator